MALYERLGGIGSNPETVRKIPVHAFMSAMQEYMLGQMTGAQATAAFDLDAGEQAEALALRDRLLTEASTNSNLARRLKALELENVLILFENAIPPYTTVAAVKARLGVP